VNDWVCAGRIDWNVIPTKPARSFARAIYIQLALQAVLLSLQVFANAFLFNPRESNVGVMATTLQVGTCSCSLRA
jgi:hypothetical protein